MATDQTKKLWSIGGGKGGVGKSVFTLGLGISLANLGKRVILVDGDLGGANLHTLMGLRYPPFTLEDFLLKKVARLEDLIIYTQVEGIGLICGADDILGAANPTYAQKVRLLNQIEDLPADYVLLDLGAGTSYNVLDFFNYSPGKICLLTSQATSMQNVYGFIKSALYRQISREFAKDHELINLLLQLEEDSLGKADSLNDLMRRESDPERLGRLSQLLADFQIFLVVNLVKSDRDLQAALIIEKVCSAYLSLKPQALGHLSYDPAIERAVDQMQPFPRNQRKKTQGAVDLQQIAKVLLEKGSPQKDEDLEDRGNPATKENGKSSWSRLWNWSQREVRL
ncbi:MAG: P-loop NTPase [Thermodesulfobacteriota bacterium]